ncbi:hypothetical protein FB451DRAFT_129702 [Mycena latifolia]|nr:hypothetical protein FB451DRAFT_129702 [Mycena latifolia]
MSFRYSIRSFYRTLSAVFPSGAGGKTSAILEWVPRPRLDSSLKESQPQEKGSMVVEAGSSNTRRARRRRHTREGIRNRVRAEKRDHDAAAREAAEERRREDERLEAARVSAAVSSRTEFSPWSIHSERVSVIPRPSGINPDTALVRTMRAQRMMSDPTPDSGTRVRCERCGGLLGPDGACEDHRNCVRRHTRTTRAIWQAETVRRGGATERGLQRGRALRRGGGLTRLSS